MKLTVIEGENRMPRDFIYARVSTEDQTVESQVEKLMELYPKAIVIPEIQSAVKKRPGLEGLLDQLQSGDRVIVTALDRIARSLKDAIRILELMADKGVTLISLRENIDQSTAAGRMLIQIMCSVAEFERGIISERTKAALEHRKARGVRMGRPKKWTQEHENAVEELYNQGWSITDIAKKLDISMPSVSRICKKIREA